MRGKIARNKGTGYELALNKSWHLEGKNIFIIYHAFQEDGFGMKK